MITYPTDISMITYPIAEIFSSPQGEGRWTGTRMTFVRFAGCNVGKPYTNEEREQKQLAVYQERCTAWNGESFACDTNYKAAQKLSIPEIMKQLPDKRVCITGGEPLIHDLMPFVYELTHTGKLIHVETSGTKPLTDIYSHSGQIIWITVSPKQGYLDASLALASEIKVLVGNDFDEELFAKKFKQYFYKVYIQPINGLNDICHFNMQKCLDIQEKYREVTISSQLHKLWKVR